tara:strand:- start:60 stop:545 length:486 start_codon:yes stop_codon:yes gene_type:complete
MFENLKERGEALRDFFKKDKEEEKDNNIVDKTVKVLDAREKNLEERTDVEKLLGQTEDTSKTESIIDVLKKEEAEKKEDTEDDLEKKLASIEKVIDTFSESPIKPAKSPFSAKDVIKINEPVDFSALMAKEFVNPFILNKPSSQTNRIDLLYETLKKQNLI